MNKKERGKRKGNKRLGDEITGDNGKFKPPTKHERALAGKERKKATGQMMDKQREKGESYARKYKLDVVDASNEDREALRKLAFVPVLSGADVGLTVMDAHQVRPQGFGTVPRRPEWSYADSVKILEEREKESFNQWKSRVVEDCFFERNLETWRQLWRVVERSDVLILVIDIRFPALHFVPDFYNYVRESRGKEFIIALNKCDLVSDDIRDAWCKYFEKEFAHVKVVSFSSFPDERLAPCEANSELLSKRERRMARSKLAAWGSDRLFDAVSALPLPEAKKDYLKTWRDKIRSEDSPNALNSSEEEGTFVLPGTRPINKALDLEDGDDIETNKGRKSGKKGRRRKPRGKPVPNRIPVDDENKNIDDKQSGQNIISNNKSSAREEDEDRTLENVITIGVVGHPNAGKSSMINGIFQKKVVSTSKTPGHTKHLQTMFLTPNVRLCDCPGLVFPARAAKELQIIAGMYPVAQVREPYAVVKYIADRLNLPKILKIDDPNSRAKLREEKFIDEDETWTAYTICEAWALQKGFRNAKSARLDVFRAANNILRMAVEGRLVLSTVPPGFANGVLENTHDVNAEPLV